MSVCCIRSVKRLVVALAMVAGTSSIGLAAQSPAELAPVASATVARQPTDLAGTWEITIRDGADSCRVLLRPQQAFNGEFYLGVPPACRHSIPELAKAGHWTMPDPEHLRLSETTGATVFVLAATGDAFTGAVGDRILTLKQIATAGRSVAGFAPVDPPPASSVFAAIVPVSKRTKAAAVAETPSDLGGRYAVMREKHDTGCMITLDDTSRVKGGARAQLAPGCRDQGIVIFDPAAWQVVKGELVLTARAGHKAHLQKSGIDSWQKDPKDGGKPLGLKKL